MLLKRDAIMRLSLEEGKFRVTPYPCVPCSPLTRRRKIIQYWNLEERSRTSRVTARQSNVEVNMLNVEVTGAEKWGPHIASAIGAALVKFAI